jgi:two-component system cell cycle sensor histidine kinase/response regulator CckA
MQTTRTVQPPDRTPTRQRGWRLRAYFALLVAAFVAVAAGAAAYVFVQTDRDGRDAARQDTRAAANTAARQLGDAVATLKATVDGLAATPRIEKQTLGNPAACVLQFATPGTSSGHLDVLRADGTTACSSRPHKGSAPLAGYKGASWLRAANAGALVQAPVVDTVSGGHALLVTKPIRGGIIAVFYALEALGPDLARLYDGGKPLVFLVTSRDGKTVLARSIAPRRWVGKSIKADLQATSAAVEHRDLDGKTRLYSTAPVPGVGWRFLAGENKHAALAAGTRLRNHQLEIILAGLALVLAAAFAVYRRVAIPVSRLGAAVRATSALTPPLPVAVSGPMEVAALGNDVNALIASVTRELEERERAEQSALASESSYHRLFESSPVPMWVYDLETLEILEVNAAAMAQYGHSREQLLALAMNDIEPARKPGEPPPPGAARAVRHVTRDGSAIEARTICHSVMFGERPARFVLAEDVGERERLEGRLRQAQRMEAIGRLAGGVAHDFNNLVMVMMGYSDLLLAHTAADDPRRGHAEEIKKAGERGAVLTKQLLSLGGEHGVEPVVLDLNGAIAGLEQMLRRLIRSNVVIDTRPGPDVSRILADRGQIEQMLVNLVVNASDAMPDGGTLTIATTVTDLDADYLRDHPSSDCKPGRYTVLEVADTGVGMDADTMAHIFEPFYTTKAEEQGTGLGLATVYGIVAQIGGFVWAYSEPGQGTTFKIYLPAAKAAVITQPPSERAAPLAAAGRTVLLVEDDPTVRAIVRRMLEAEGFAILEAAEGAEALALSQAGAPDSLGVLVTDTIIPGPGGADLAHRVRGRHPALRTVIMSGYTERITAGKETLGPRTEFLAKPFTAADLHAKLAVLLPGSD